MTSPLLSCPVPPDPRRFDGSIMLSLATGRASVSEVRRGYVELAATLDDAQFREYFPASQPVAPADVPALVDEIAALHNSLVTRLSDDAARLMRALVDASRAGLVIEFGDAVDDDDALELAHQIHASEELAEPGRYWGYVYADAQDLEQMVLTGGLSLGFGTFGDREPGDAARAFLDHLHAQRLPAWLDEAAHEIVVQPVRFEVPLEG